MTISQEFYNEFESLPQSMQIEIMHYTQFLKTKFAETKQTPTEKDVPSQAWLAGQGLFACHQGAEDLSQQAKIIAERNIREKHA